MLCSRAEAVPHARRSQFALSTRPPASTRCPLFYDTPPVLFSRLSRTKLLASTTRWPRLFIALKEKLINSCKKISENVLRTNKPPLVRFNHGAICLRVGLRRGEQDRSRCQHEFASLVCLLGASAEKTAQSHWAGAPAPISYSPRGRLTRLSVVSNETLFFPVPLFSNSPSALFFWIGNGIRQTKNWQKYGRWKIVGIAIGSAGSRLAVCKKIFTRCFSCLSCFVALIAFHNTQYLGRVPTLNSDIRSFFEEDAYLYH